MSLPTNKPFLVNYPNQVYVETGVWRGDSLQLALEAGFKKVIGIDLDPTSLEFCWKRFDLHHHDELRSIVRLVCGDSATCLWDTIRDVDVSMTVLLDAHWQLHEGTERGEHPFPLLDEIRQLAQHPIKTHTIIVDDLLYMTHPMVTGWSYPDIMQALCEINPDYKFELLANPIVSNLLVAHP